MPSEGWWLSKWTWFLNHIHISPYDQAKETQNSERLFYLLIMAKLKEVFCLLPTRFRLCWFPCLLMHYQFTGKPIKATCTLALVCLWVCLLLYQVKFYPLKLDLHLRLSAGRFVYLCLCTDYRRQNQAYRHCCLGGPSISSLSSPVSRKYAMEDKHGFCN